jgi:hypothetical protein
VPFAYPELAVRAPEFLQVRDETIAGGLALEGIGDPAEGVEELPPLRVHRGREHGPDLAVHGEELRVEVCHCRVSGRLEQPE